MTRNERNSTACTMTRATPREEPDEPIDGLAEKNLRILEAVYHEAALIASEDRSPLSPEEIEDDVALGDFVARLLQRP